MRTHTQRAWSPKEENLLRALYARKPMPELASMFKRSACAIKSRAGVLGLKRGNHKCWTATEDKILKQLYPDTPGKKIAQRFNRSLSQVYRRARRLGLEKTTEYIAQQNARLGKALNKSGAAYRFPPGHVPGNKGTRRPGWAPGRMALTQFKKGQKSRNWMPLGSTRFSKEGYQMRKVADTGYPPTDWKFVHTILWEEANGPVPAGHALSFKDRDRQNISLDNLELITRRELMLRNTVHNLPKPLKEVLLLKAAINRQITIKTRKTKPMEATACQP